MKRITLMLGLLLITGGLYAQTDEPIYEGKNELRLNMLNTLLGSIEPQYERLFNDNSSLNLMLGIGYQVKESPYSHYISFSPAYRQYFGKKPGAGFFLEANFRTSNDFWEEYIYPDYDFDKVYPPDYSFEPIINEYTGFNLGIGFGVGIKFITHTNLVGTLKGGLGRFITGNHGFDDYYPNVEVSIGKRF